MLTYVGKHSTVDDGDVQRIKAGEIGEDDVLGDVTIISFDGGDITIDGGDSTADGMLSWVELQCNISPVGRLEQCRFGI